MRLTWTRTSPSFGAGRSTFANSCSNDARLICALIALHSIAYFAMAWLILARRRLPHRHVGLVGLVGGLILGAIALI